MLVTNALLSVTIRHEVITSILSTKEKSTDTQFHWRWGCWNPAPRADQGVLKTLESITLQFSHLLAGDFRYVIWPLWALVSSWANWRKYTHFIGWLRWITASNSRGSTPSISAPFSSELFGLKAAWPIYCDSVKTWENQLSDCQKKRTRPTSNGSSPGLLRFFRRPPLLEYELFLNTCLNASVSSALITVLGP